MLALKEFLIAQAQVGVLFDCYLKGIVANNNKTIDDGKIVKYK
jgi:hypothetical protein